MLKKQWNLERDLSSLRKEFPILKNCVYLISNSLGAVPGRVKGELEKYYSLWSEEGVTAWQKEWWDLPRKIGDWVAALLHAGENEVTMMVNATLGHWVALSTKFMSKNEKRNKIVITDQDFPSSIYAITKIAEFMSWDIDTIRSHGHPGIHVEEILSRVDEKTLFVATSHVYFKSGYIQDIAKIAYRARKVGAITVIDGYHAPGTIPVDVKKLDVDFYIGGCLKWLCGGPGNAFLYVKPELASRLDPYLTGWIAHKSPFSFREKMKYTEGSYKFMSGTPPVTCLYTALAGLKIIQEIGSSQIRQKSLSQTRLTIEKARERNYKIFSPEDKNHRGGAVSIVIPHAFQVKQALEERRIKVDFRKGENNEPDVIRIGPHFYTKDEEIEILFKEIDSIFASGEFLNYQDEIKYVT